MLNVELAEELEIVKKAKSDIKSFDDIYRYYLPKILGFCINRIPNKDIAEEITSSVFFDAVKSISKFDTTRGISFGSWLYRVAHNRIVDYFRSSSRRQTVNIEENDPGYNEDFEANLQKIENQKKISIVMSQLNKRYQEVLSLRYYSELSNDEIAKVLKTNNVAVLIHRALKAFQQKFKKIYKDSEIFDLF